ncbi:hypothetical protein TgHK011_000621 [Trichoderma gracile]|nr:hypothetical protein TgHK011_000621 [Trichoderma gracile]
MARALNTSPSTMHRHEPRDQRHVESHRSQSFLQLWRRIGTGHQEATASDATPPMYATVHMSYQHHCRRQHRNIEYRKRKVVKARDQCISGREHMRALSTVISASAHAASANAVLLLIHDLQNSKAANGPSI